MDELRVASRFMRGILAKVLEGSIRKCCGVKVKINLDSLAIRFDENGESTIDVQGMKVKMTSKDLEKVLTGKLGLEDEE